MEKKGTTGIRKINIEPVPQREDFDCGPAAVCTFLLFLGRDDLLKSDIYRKVGYDRDVGTLVENITGFFDEEKLEYEEMVGATLADLEECLDTGRVCLVDYQAWGTEAEKEAMVCGHYSVVFYMDENEVWLIDPSFDYELEPGQGVGVVRRNREMFDKWWTDGEDGSLYDHWMVSAQIRH